jgi:uncharacterized protein
MEFHLVILLILFSTGIIAGFIDTVVGGGGLITVPVMLSVGLPPAITLGTNRLQGCIGEMTATTYYLKNNYIDFKSLIFGLAMTAIGSVLGTLVITFVHPDHLARILPILILLVLVYLLISPKLKERNKPLLNSHIFYLVFGVLIGGYNGFFGPNTGSFWTIALMFFLAFDIRSAIMHSKALNFTGNLISLFIFIAINKIGAMKI